MRRLRFLLPTAGVLWAACAPPTAPALQVHSLTQPADGPCPAGGGGAEFAQEVTALGASIKAPDLKEVISGSGDLTGVTIENVPAGVARVISLFGLAGGQPTWRGVSAPVEVKAGESTPVDILLAKVAAMSCTRNSSLEKRVFHTATQLDDGTVLVVGGAKRMVDASVTCGTGCKEAAATESASIYDPKTGQFTAVGPLSTARMFHTAVKLADGRVVVSGGTRAALFHKPAAEAQFKFPIEPTAPLASIEVYDPQSKSFSAVGDDPNGARVFAAATTLITGEAIITGGIPDAAPTNDLNNALSTTTLCGGKPIVCQNGPPMSSKRAGHLAFTFDPEGVFVWGGSVEGDADGFQLEALRPGSPTFDLIESCGINPQKNVFFAAGANYSGIRMLAAGGLLRNTDGTFQASIDGDNEGASVYVFDLAGSCEPGGVHVDTSIAQGKTGNRLNLTGPRFLASAAGLPDQASVFIAGGFTVPARFADVDFTPVDTIERFLEITGDDGKPDTVMDTLSQNSVLPTLHEPRGGATATAIGDGTVVVIGGRNDVDAVETAEVFADPKVPPQAAGFVP